MDLGCDSPVRSDGRGVAADTSGRASGGGGSSFVAPQVTGVVNTPGGAPRSSTPADGSVIISFTPSNTCPAAALSVSPRFTG
jgi:hypothetical protein